MPKKPNTTAAVLGNGLKIDAEFRDLIEPLLPAEIEQLTLNLQKAGRALDPLKVWKGYEIVLDGHNRLEICTENELPYAIEYIDLPDREACKKWIIDNQIGRRNLSPARMDYLRGKKLELEKGPRGGKRGAAPPAGSKDQSGPSPTMRDALHPEKPARKKGDAAQRIAEETGVSRSTVKRNEQFTKAVDRIGNYFGILKYELLSGKRRMSQWAAESVNALKPKVLEKLCFSLNNDRGMSVDSGLSAIGKVQNIPAPSAARKTASPELSNVLETVATRLSELSNLIGPARDNFPTPAKMKQIRQRVKELIEFVNPIPFQETA